MEFEPINLPADYTPYKQVEFCSNTLINVEYFINDNGFLPLLIGKGTIPKVWIFARDKDKKILEIVNKSISKFPLVSVNIDDDNKKISIMLNENHKLTQLLEIAYSSDEILIVNKVDLQPIGYNITGDKSTLKVGSNGLSRNKIHNSKVFISVG